MQDAIVFMVGGGNYIEYQNLVDFIASKSSNQSGIPGYPTHQGMSGGSSSLAGPQKRIVYGCSMLNNANQLLQQLAELGHNM